VVVWLDNKGELSHVTVSECDENVILAHFFPCTTAPTYSSRYRVSVTDFCQRWPSKLCELMIRNLMVIMWLCHAPSILFATVVNGGA
jgi:hypothetical protein